MSNFTARLREAVEHNGVTLYEVSKATGITQATLSRLINGITKKTNPKNLTLLAHYLRVNEHWLRTGEGEMIKENIVNYAEKDYFSGENQDIHTISTGKVIPFYDAEAAAGTSYSMEMTPSRPIGMIEIGGLLKDSESALRVYGNSMTPNYPAGCVVGTKRHKDSFIVPGEVYLVETQDNRYLKRLYYNKDKSAFRCLSDNHMVHTAGPMIGELCYPEFEIPLKEVSRLHRVTGVIKRNIL